MIPADFITQWRQQVPWPLSAQVEQDLIISRAITDIFSHASLRSSLAFRGGTAFYKLHCEEPARYSEDIDLVQINNEPAGDMVDGIRGQLDSWLGTPSRKFGEGRVTLVYRILSDDQVPLKLKVEVNTREHYSCKGFCNAEFALESRWYSSNATVTTYSLHELLGTKMRALFQRNKGRDLFDLWYGLTHHSLNPIEIIECFLFYVDKQGIHISRLDFLDNLARKMDDHTFRSDIVPLLSPGMDYDIDAACSCVREELLQELS